MSNTTDRDARADKVHDEVIESIIRLRRANQIVTLASISRDVPPGLKVSNTEIDRSLQWARRAGVIVHVRKLNPKTGRERRDYGWMVR